MGGRVADERCTCSKRDSPFFYSEAVAASIAATEAHALHEVVAGVCWLSRPIDPNPASWGS